MRNNHRRTSIAPSFVSILHMKRKCDVGAISLCLFIFVIYYKFIKMHSSCFGFDKQWYLSYKKVQTNESELVNLELHLAFGFQLSHMADFSLHL